MAGIIVIKNDKIYLTQDHYLLLSQTRIKFADPFKSPAYIVVKILDYTDDGSIFIEPVSYHPGSSNFDNNQLRMTTVLNKITNIKFSNLDTEAIFSIKKGKNFRRTQPRHEIYRNIPLQSETATVTPKKFVETYLINFKDIVFGDGLIHFSIKIKRPYDIVDISIENPFLKKEFNAVKSYFAKALNTKKIEVKVSVEYHYSTVLPISATSPQIAMINEDFIKDIRINYLRASIKKKLENGDGNKIFTTDSLFDKISTGEINQTIFYQNDDSFLNDVIKITETKHSKHLKYLSEILDAKTMKLRFITKPFSFIFLISGKSKYHIIWETLDTKEATYIWTIDKNIGALKNGFSEIEDIINRLLINGKTSYIQSENNSSKRIYHDYSDTNVGFLNWKNSIKSILT